MGALADTPAKSKGTVCVTGATGYVASWLIKRLLAEGYRVRGTVRDPDNVQKAAHLWVLPGARERLELVKGDLLAEGSYDAAVEGCEGVFHTAASLAIIKSDPKTEMIDPAVLGTLNVLKSCVKASSVKRVVLTSSSAAVRFNPEASADIPLDEFVWSNVHFCTENKIWYSVAKTVSEQEAWKFASQHHLDLVVVLPSFVIGPCLPPTPSKTANDVLNLLNGDAKFGMNGRMGYVHLDDVAHAHILVYEAPSAEGRYICSAEEIVPQELAQRLAPRYPDLPIPHKFVNVPPMPYYTLNSTKLVQLGLKFQPLEAMFDDCVASFRDKGLLGMKSHPHQRQNGQIKNDKILLS